MATWRADIQQIADIATCGRARRVFAPQRQVYYQALTKRKLGQEDNAQQTFQDLADASNPTLQPAIDQTDDAPRLADGRKAIAHCISGLGHPGLGEKNKAKSEFESALREAPDFLPARTELARLKSSAP